MNWYTKIKTAEKLCINSPSYSKYPKTKCIEVFWNPDRKTYRQLNKEIDILRGFIFPQSNKVLLWNAYDAMHYAVSNTLKEQYPEIKNAIPVEMAGKYMVVTDYSKNTGWHESQDVAQTVKNTPAVQNIIPHGPEINYYNEAIVGDWSKLEDESELV